MKPRPTEKDREEARVRLNEFNAKQTDWYATCRVCGARLEGSIAQIKEHKHEPAA